MRAFAVLALAALLALPAASARAQEDTRELVKMPEMMQQHMLANMRDHLTTLNEILADLAAEKYSDAGKVAEARLGMSSLGLHGAAHMAQFMPPAMQDTGTALHHAASRFALAAEVADVDRSYAAMQKLTGALAEMTAACTACHAGFRIR